MILTYADWQFHNEQFHIIVPRVDSATQQINNIYNYLSTVRRTPCVLARA